MIQDMINGLIVGGVAIVVYVVGTKLYFAFKRCLLCNDRIGGKAWVKQSDGVLHYVCWHRGYHNE